MKQNRLRIITIAIVTLSFIPLFQNCSKVQVAAVDSASGLDAAGSSDSSANSEENDPNHTSANDDLGLKGGHFDFDTASNVYSFDYGKSDKHTHEYDNKFDIRYVDLFNILDSFSWYDNAKHTTITSRVAPTQEFIITVANAESSPGVLLNINGTLISVSDYQKKVDEYIAGNKSALETFNLGTLQQFKIEFASETISENILVPIYYKCPIQNKASASGQYRNGALTIQIHDKTTVKLDSKTRVATKDGGLRWEAFLFWHRDNKCR